MRRSDPHSHALSAQHQAGSLCQEYEAAGQYFSRKSARCMACIYCFAGCSMPLEGRQSKTVPCVADACLQHPVACLASSKQCPMILVIYQNQATCQSQETTTLCVTTAPASTHCFSAAFECWQQLYQHAYLDVLAEAALCNSSDPIEMRNTDSFGETRLVLHVPSSS